MMCSPGTMHRAEAALALRYGSRLRSSSRSICVTSATPLRCAFATIAGQLGELLLVPGHHQRAAFDQRQVELVLDRQVFAIAGLDAGELDAALRRVEAGVQQRAVALAGAVRMSAPASSRSARAPAMARRRKMAQPTTPAPMMTALLCAMSSLTRRRFAGDLGRCPGVAAGAQIFRRWNDFGLVSIS